MDVGDQRGRGLRPGLLRPGCRDLDEAPLPLVRARRGPPRGLNRGGHVDLGAPFDTEQRIDRMAERERRIGAHRRRHQRLGTGLHPQDASDRLDVVGRSGGVRRQRQPVRVARTARQSRRGQRRENRTGQRRGLRSDLREGGALPQLAAAQRPDRPDSRGRPACDGQLPVGVGSEAEIERAGFGQPGLEQVHHQRVGARPHRDAGAGAVEHCGDLQGGTVRRASPRRRRPCRAHRRHRPRGRAARRSPAAGRARHGWRDRRGAARGPTGAPRWRGTRRATARPGVATTRT